VDKSLDANEDGPEPEEASAEAKRAVSAIINDPNGEVILSQQVIEFLEANNISMDEFLAMLAKQGGAT